MVRDALLLLLLLLALPVPPGVARFDDGHVRFDHPAAVAVRPVTAPSDAPGAPPAGVVAHLLDFSPDAFLVVERHADLADPSAFASARARALVDEIARGLARAGFVVEDPREAPLDRTGEAGLVAGRLVRYAVGGERYLVACRVYRRGAWHPVLCEARPDAASTEIALWADRIGADLARGEPRQ